MRLPLTCALNADSSEIKVKTLDKINRNNERQRLRDNLSNLRTFEVSAQILHLNKLRRIIFHETFNTVNRYLSITRFEILFPRARYFQFLACRLLYTAMELDVPIGPQTLRLKLNRTPSCANPCFLHYFNRDKRHDLEKPLSYTN